LLAAGKGEAVPKKPIITLTTDFGLQDHYVGTMKGVLLREFPEVQIVDICHAVQPFDVLDGALTLAEAYPYFPSGTVHLVVVDPGVGSARKPIAVTTQTQHFVAPDNGVLSLVYEREERAVVREITASHYFLQPMSNTFHGRDVFAPVAAAIARGVDPQRLGDVIQDFVRFTAPKPKVVDTGVLRGVILKADRFGNLITNISPSDAPFLVNNDGVVFRLTAGTQEITSLRANYAEGVPGEVFAIWGSMGLLEIASNRSSAARALGIAKGMEVVLTFEGAAAASGQAM
jgi:S-adenosylmethionine hydrolase